MVRATWYILSAGYQYGFYLDWMEQVFPPGDMNYEHIYRSAVPDTLVWRDVLGAFFCNRPPLKLGPVTQHDENLV